MFHCASVHVYMLMYSAFVMHLCAHVCVCLLHSVLLTCGLLQGLSYKKEVVLTTGQGGLCTLYYPFTVNHLVVRMNLVQVCVCLCKLLLAVSPRSGMCVPV